MNRRQASRIRQLLVKNERAREPPIALLLALGPLIEGSFLTFSRKCGKPNCRCVSGEPHESQVLSRSVDGKAQTRYVKVRDRRDVETKVGTYRQLRKARAELMKLATQTAGLIDQLVEALREPYPAEQSERVKGKTSRETRRSERGDGTKG